MDFQFRIKIVTPLVIPHTVQDLIGSRIKDPVNLMPAQKQQVVIWWD